MISGRNGYGILILGNGAFGRQERCHIEVRCDAPRPPSMVRSRSLEPAPLFGNIESAFFWKSPKNTHCACQRRRSWNTAAPPSKVQRTLTLTLSLIALKKGSGRIFVVTG